MRKRSAQVLLASHRGSFASEVLTPKDSPFVRELVLGITRRQLTLDTIQNAFGKRSAQSLDPEVAIAIRLGLYQMIFMDGVPVHAAVSESVDTLHKASQKSYVNGVLRGFVRASHRVPADQDRGDAKPSCRLERPGKTVTFFSREVFPDPEKDREAWLASVYSHPAFLVHRWVEREGEAKAIQWMEENNRPAPLVLRPRLGRLDSHGLVERMRGEGVAAGAVTREGEEVVEVAAGSRGAFSGKAFKEGLFTVQDPAQMAAAEILAPQKGEMVWDACAAPGGKTTQLGEMIERVGGGQVMATDRSESRLASVAENVHRLGLASHVTTGVHDLLSGDDPPGKPERGFDAILVDAPCSNAGVLGRRPEARWRLKPEIFEECATRQASLLAAAQKHLAPEGRLVYSVCSLEPEETTGHELEPTRAPNVFLGGGSSMKTSEAGN